MKKADGSCGPGSLGLNVEGGSDHRLQQPVDEQAIGDDPDQRVAA